MDEVSIEKIQISGPTLASLLHRFSSSVGDIHGLLFGQVTLSTATSFSDDSAAVGADTAPSLTATITSFLSFPSHFPLPLPPPQSANSTLIGWFSGRRRTPLRPSLKESSATFNLSSSNSLSFTPQNSTFTLTPSLFLLLTTPLQDQLIHTHEYKAYQYRISGSNFEPRILSIINIGPSFRSHFDSFFPHAPFPLMNCELRGSNAMVEDENASETLGAIKQGVKDQKQLDMCAEGFDIGKLSKLIGSEAANYTAGLEDLYDKMLAKIDGLAKLVEQTSTKVLEQENQNMKIRYKVAGLE